MLFGVLNALANGVGNLGSLAQTEAYQAVAVAHNHQGSKLEDTAALNRLADTVDGYDLFTQIQFGCVDSCQKYPSFVRT